MTDSFPRRVVRRRVKGWRMPPNTKSVTRPGRYGNPFRPAECSAWIEANGPTGESAQEMCVRWHREWLAGQRAHPSATPPSRDMIVRDLRGFNLACYCAHHLPCHVDNMLEVANS